MTPEQEAACLHWHPFADDFGEPGDRVLSDKVTTARKAGPCFDCEQPIAPGDRTRALSAKFSGELKRYRWCAACCVAMTADDPTEAMEKRLALRGTCGVALPDGGQTVEALREANAKLAGALDMVRETLQGGNVQDLLFIINEALAAHRRADGGQTV